jgi:hypothetical protein
MRFPAVLLLLATLSCGLEINDDFPHTAIPFAPNLNFRAWWQIVEECSGQKRSFDGVSWYRVAPGQLSIRGGSAAGAWFARGNRVVFTESYLDQAPLVRHEMLHAVLQTGSHPPQYFQGKCGAEVACGQECGAEETLARAHPLALDLLQTSVSLHPTVPSDAALDGRVTVALTLRNPFAENVFVTVENGYWQPCTFGMMIESVEKPGWTELACEYLGYANDGRIYFRPKETRRVVFDVDLRRPSYGAPFRPGAVTVSAIVDNIMRESISATILP